MMGLSFSRSAALIPAIVGVTLRQLLGRRRALLLTLFCAVPILIALLYRAANGEDVDHFAGIIEVLCLNLILPIVAVLFGTAAFGAEIEDGTIVYLMAKPVGRWALVAGKLVATVSLTAFLTAGSVFIACLIAIISLGERGLEATEIYTTAMVVGSICYVSLFVALSLFTRRALLIGFGYVMVWEAMLSNLLPGIANLSIRQYSLGVGQIFHDLPPERAAIEPATAVPLAIILVVVATVLATRKLMRLEIAGSTD
jgi:ABC-2 type transport system permease protein